MKRKENNYAIDVKESRRITKLPLRFLVHGEAEEINLEDGWTAEYAGRFHEGVILNADIGGLLIATNPNRIPSIGGKITALFKLKSINEKIRIDGDVVWINKYSQHYPKGFAIKFTDISINGKTLRKGIENSWEPEKFNGIDLLNVPD